MMAETTLRVDPSAVQRWCGGALYLAACFPFVSPVPLPGTDTQPLCLLFAALLLLVTLATSGIARRDMLLLFAASASLVYLNPLGNLFGEVGKSVSLLAGMGILVACRMVDPSLAYRLLRFAIVAYFIGSCLIMLAPDLFLSLQGHIVRAVNVDDTNPLGYRGVPTFATEPGLLGGLLVFFLLELRGFGAAGVGSVRQRWVLAMVVGATILLTKSGMGYFYLVLFLGVTTLQDRMHSKTAIVVACLLVLAGFGALLAVATALEIDNRGLQLLAGIASGSLGEDTSVLKRVWDLMIGLISLAEHPFGVGANMVDPAANQIAFAHGLVRDVDYGGAISLVSGLSWMLVAYGVLGLAFLLYVFFKYSRASWPNKLFALVFFSFSYSPAFPAIWILLARPPTVRRAPQVASG
jgi:hypothetical protein